MKRLIATRYIVDTTADIEDVRTALVNHVTVKLGHVVYINAHESMPLADAMRPPNWLDAFVLRHRWLALACIGAAALTGVVAVAAAIWVWL